VTGPDASGIYDGIENPFETDSMRLPCLIGLSLVVLSSGLRADETSTAKGSKRLFLSDPSPDDWRKIENPGSVVFVSIMDYPSDATHVDDEDLDNLVKFTAVKTLWLESDSLDDSAIPKLLKLQDLEALLIYNCKFSDAGIQQLSGLSSLQTVGFFQTAVTTTGVGKLQEQLPHAHIEIWEGDAAKRPGQVFDANGCPTTAFLKKHWGFRVPAPAGPPAN